MSKHQFIFILLFFLILIFSGFLIFSPVYYSNSIIINYGLKPYDICIKQPNTWHYLKLLFIIFYILSSVFISNFIYLRVFSKIFESHKPSNKQTKYINNFLNKKDTLQLFVGKNLENNKVFIPEKGLYQNILVTGTIGSGKTSSALYPFTEQLIKFKSTNNLQKIGMLILDVKGNYYLHVQKLCKKYNRTNDLVILELGGKFTYNPLDKPTLSPTILANRLKTILLLFSQNNSESYWLDKTEEILKECIKFCRLYNNGYVTFEEIHKLVTQPDYFKEKIPLLREDFKNNKLSKEDCYNLFSCLNFFENELLQLDPRTLNILKSEITRITNCFISDYKAYNTFNPKKTQTNFSGISDISKKGKIVVLNMNIAEYKNLSKIIAAYLKLDFQSEVLSKISNKNNNIKLRTTAFICDEYHEYITHTDSDFFAQSREAKCINIVSTQSYTSLLNTLNNVSTLKVVIQNLINKFWFRTDDIFTIEEVQKQIGKEDKKKFSKTVSESAKQTDFNYFTNTLNSKNSNISESINSYYQNDFIYDTNFFTQHLETFNSLAFLSDGNTILQPQKIIMQPFFNNN